MNRKLVDIQAAEANERLVRALADDQTIQSYQRGAILFSEGERPSGLYILFGGSVDMIFASQNSRSIRMGVIGTVLGLNAVISGRTHQYTTEALDGVVVGYVPEATFFRVVESGGLWMDVLKIMSRDVGSCYERVRDLVENSGHAASHRASVAS